MKGTLVIVGFLLGCAVASSAESVPNPTVLGPIPANAAPGNPSHDYPFFSTNIDLASRGYVEEEFFFEGTANTYNIDPAVPKMDTAIVTSSGNFYRTRMVVRRPISAEDFNGTVLMEWQNSVAGYEIDATWLASHDHIMRRGYAWIGVSVEQTGIMGPFGLRAWSPIRYGVGSATPLTMANAYLWDVFTQAAQAVRHPQGIDPMAGLKVERVFALGWSLSAQRLVTYHNSIQPLAGIFDAFDVIGLDGSQFRLFRTDLDVKVFKISTETYVAGLGAAVSQAWIRNQEPNTDHFRRWEVAGASHLGYHEIQEVTTLQARDLPPSPPPTCELPPSSRIPSYFVFNAAYDHMVEWVKHNVQPPIGDDIQIAVLDPQDSIIARDSYGNALGGIRLSQHAVATATNTGLNGPTTNLSCRIAGSYVPFDQATLDALYPDHQTYLRLVIKATHETQKDGFIVGADAAATIRDAARSDIGRQ